MGGLWVKVESDRCIQTSGKNNPGDMVEAGLPNITGSIEAYRNPILKGTGTSGAFSHSGSLRNNVPNYDTMYGPDHFHFNASKSNAIYGNSDTVQPPAYIVIGWKRES